MPRSNGGAWLTVSPASVNIAATATSTLALAFDVVATNLLPGNYVGHDHADGHLHSHGPGRARCPKAIAVNLRVTPIGAAVAVDQTMVGVDTTPVVDEWKPMADNTLYTARKDHTAIWTGREMWIFSRG